MKESGEVKDHTALVTGASSGIGLELARCFAANGYALILVARDQPRLEHLAQELRSQSHQPVTVIPKDLAQPNATAELMAQITQHGLHVDLLVNNAGFGSHGLFAEADLEQQTRMVQVNVTALMQLTRLCLPDMISRHRGKILNVASTAAFQPGPLMAVYYATKAFVVSFSRALENELAGTGVTVTALCPGPTATEFQRRAGVERTRLMTQRIMDAQTVARIGYDALMRGQAIVIPGARNRLLASAVRFLPARLVMAAVRKMQEDRKRISPSR